MFMYIPLQYFAKDIIGYTPYYDADPSTLGYYIGNGINILAALVVYYVCGFLNNFIKTGEGASHIRKVESYILDSYANIMKLI